MIGQNLTGGELRSFFFGLKFFYFFIFFTFWGKTAGVDYIAANTDAQALDKNDAKKKIQLGSSGVGAGADPGVGTDTHTKTKEI
jgi:cell division GTPase FtsZ